VSVIEADVVVVGGGVMGSAAAWQLAARGADTVLLERFEPGHVRGGTVGDLESPHLSGQGARVRAPLAAEQLGLDERGR